MKKEKASIPLTAISIFISVLILVPLLVMILGSFKTSAEAQQYNLSLPARWNWENYVYVFNVGKIGTAFVNSVIVTFFTVALCIVFSALAAFVISRRQDKSSSWLYNIFLLGMIAPLQVVTTFGLLKLLNIIGSYLGVILIMTAVQIPWCVFIFSGFIRTVPRTLDEAAYIDGAGTIRIFFQIVLPLLKPVMATCVVSTSMTAWNEFMIPLYFLNSSSKWTLPLTVYNFFGQYSSDWNYVFVDLVLTALPIVILYLYCQKYIISGMTAGAVKG